MKYTVATFAKAIVAFIVSGSGALVSSGADLNHLSVGTVLTALGVAATAAGAVFVTPNKPHDNTTAAEQIVNNIPVVVAQANAAVSDLNKVKNAAADLASIVPGVGPLAEAVINSVKLP